MKFILGKKLGMSQVFNEEGEVAPVTIVKAGPCRITGIRTQEKDGYSAVQIGFGENKKLNKPEKGYLKDLPSFRYLVEFRSDKTQGFGAENKSLNRGDAITVEIFAAGDKVGISGVSKGKGFQGVVRRHHFHGAPATHGHKDQLRKSGSIGATDPQRVFPGKRMPGRMGGERVTVKNLEIVKIDLENNLLYIKGAVPGARNGLLEIAGEGDLKIVRAGNAGVVGNTKDVEANKINVAADKVDNEEIGKLGTVVNK